MIRTSGRRVGAPAARWAGVSRSARASGPWSSRSSWRWSSGRGWVPGGRPRGTPAAGEVRHLPLSIGVILASYSLARAARSPAPLDLAEELLEDHRGLDGGPARSGRGQLRVGGRGDERLGELVVTERGDVVGVGRAEARSAELLLVLGAEDDLHQLLGAARGSSTWPRCAMFEPPAKTGAGLPSLPGSDEGAELLGVPLAHDLAVLLGSVTDRPVRPARRHDRGGGEGGLAGRLAVGVGDHVGVVDVEPRGLVLGVGRRVARGLLDLPGAAAGP